jgi:hypothetical protein
MRTNGYAARSDPTLITANASVISTASWLKAVGFLKSVPHLTWGDGHVRRAGHDR